MNPLQFYHIIDKYELKYLRSHYTDIETIIEYFNNINKINVITIYANPSNRKFSNAFCNSYNLIIKDKYTYNILHAYDILSIVKIEYVTKRFKGNPVIKRQLLSV